MSFSFYTPLKRDSNGGFEARCAKFGSRIFTDFNITCNRFHPEINKIFNFH